MFEFHHTPRVIFSPEENNRSEGGVNGTIQTIITQLPKPRNHLPTHRKHIGNAGPLLTCLRTHSCFQISFLSKSLAILPVVINSPPSGGKWLRPSRAPFLCAIPS